MSLKKELSNPSSLNFEFHMIPARIDRRRRLAGIDDDAKVRCGSESQNQEVKEFEDLEVEFWQNLIQNFDC